MRIPDLFLLFESPRPLSPSQGPWDFLLTFLGIDSLTLSQHGSSGLVAKSCLTLVTPWTVACQSPLSMGFSREEYWSGLPFLSSGDHPDPGIKYWSPAWQADSLLIELREKSPPYLLSKSVLYNKIPMHLVTQISNKVNYGIHSLISIKFVKNLN